jgi:hypothetical protein
VRTITLVVAAVLAGLYAAGLSAHHSLGATYDMNKEVELEGEIAQFLFRNPHSYLHVEAPDANGVMQRWSLEWRDAGSLREQGMGRDVLKVGDKVAITMHPSRSTTDYRGALVTLYRESDGLGWGNREGEVLN